MIKLKEKFKELGFDENKVSKEEGYFYDWLLELKDKGYIHSIEIQPKYNLTQPIYLPFTRLKKIKNKAGEEKEKESVVAYSIMQGMHYTPDFNVYWNLKALDVFAFVEHSTVTTNFHESRLTKFYGELTAIEEEQVIHTCIEIKGTFASRQNSTAIKFPLLQKLLYNKYKVYVNKCMPLAKKKGLFCKTFTPKSYWLTEKSKKERKFKWTKLSVTQYLNLFINLKNKTNDENTSNKRTSSII
jgi:hypothetical protein